jgi:hypothetical protein
MQRGIFIFLMMSWSYLFAQEIPYKPDHEFSIRLDLKFMNRPISTSINKFNLSETRAEHERRTSLDPLPYLDIYLTVLEVNQGETRYRMVKDGKKISGSRKIDLKKEVKIEIGFTDDAKDKISGYEHILYFISENKNDVNRIVITIEGNGDYFVNGQNLGRL